jgi:hypothetical protein
MTHECIKRFPTRKIDNCSGEGYNKCVGDDPMVLEVWYMGQDGLEDYCDEWVAIEVKFCPFCGKESINLLNTE